MRRYEISSPEKDEWCIPAAIQTILNGREINFSQEEIANNFPEYFEDGNFRGFKFNKSLLDKFFETNNLELYCKFVNPFSNFEIHNCVDLFLSEIKKEDVLIAYNSKFQQKKSKRDKIDHLAVLLDYYPNSNMVKITGIKDKIHESISLNVLVNHMHPDKNSHYGFYVIDSKT